MCGANPERTQTGDYAITGTVAVDGVRRPGAYVRLLDKDGEFVAVFGKNRLPHIDDIEASLAPQEFL